MSSGDHKFNERRARKQRDRIIKACKKAVKNGDGDAMLHGVRLLLHSRSCKVLAVFEAAKKLKKLPNRKTLIGMGTNLSVWHPCSEPAYASYVEKDGPNADYRPVIAFGLENKARQTLVAYVLKALIKTHPCQYLLNGGRHKAIDALVSAWKQGYRYGFLLDIEKCFQNIEGKQLHHYLPLPQEVINNVILAEGYSLSVSRNLSLLHGELEGNLAVEEVFAVEDLIAFQTGIPQGSAVSPLCAEVVFHDIIGKLPEKGVVVNYADDFLVLCKDESDRKDMKKALQTALVGHPAGTLTHGTLEIVHPDKPFSYLGYDIESGPNGELKFTIGRKSRMRMERKRTWTFCAVRGDEYNATEKSAILYDYAKSIQSTLANFPRYRGRGRVQRNELRRTVSIAEDLGLLYDPPPTVMFFGRGPT